MPSMRPRGPRASRPDHPPGARGGRRAGGSTPPAGTSRRSRTRPGRGAGTPAAPAPAAHRGRTPSPRSRCAGGVGCSSWTSTCVTSAPGCRRAPSEDAVGVDPGVRPRQLSTSSSQGWSRTRSTDSRSPAIRTAPTRASTWYSATTVPSSSRSSGCSATLTRPPHLLQHRVVRLQLRVVVPLGLRSLRAASRESSRDHCTTSVTITSSIGISPVAQAIPPPVRWSSSRSTQGSPTWR